MKIFLEQMLGYLETATRNIEQDDLETSYRNVSNMWEIINKELNRINKQDEIIKRAVVGHVPEESSKAMNIKRDIEYSLYITVGLPYSGKSSWAYRYSLEHNVPIVCPDNIRLSLHGMRYSALAEDFVWAIAKVMTRSLFYSGHSIVILDATNTSKKRRDFWYDEMWKSIFILFGVDGKECIRRAKENNDTAIIPIIQRQAENFEPIENDEGDNIIEIK